jgi:light-regulated signal transduction histidine kinase (bacteriophytochrome)
MSSVDFLARLCIIDEEVRDTMQKRTMTLNLSDAEMQVLEKLSTQKDLTKTALLRQALRLYQLVDTRLTQGHKLFFEDEHKKEKAELMVL